MIVLFVISICLKCCFAEHEQNDRQQIFYDDIFPEKYAQKTTPVQYKDLLNILHNDDSNKVLLAKINTNPLEVDPWNSELRYGDMVIVRDSSFDDEDNRELDIAYRNKGIEVPSEVEIVVGKKRNADNLKEKLKSLDLIGLKKGTDFVDNRNKISADNPKIKKLHLTRLKRNTEINDNIDNEADYMNLNDLNENPTLKIKSYLKRLKKEVENENLDSQNAIRPRRGSAIKFLKDLFISEINSKPEAKSALPIYLKQSHQIDINNSFADIVANLTSSIEKLNQNLIDMKVASGDQGFVLIKVPPNEADLQNSTRTKREVIEKVETSTAVHNTKSNITEEREQDTLSKEKTKDVEEINKDNLNLTEGMHASEEIDIRDRNVYNNEAKDNVTNEDKENSEENNFDLENEGRSGLSGKSNNEKSLDVAKNKNEESFNVSDEKSFGKTQDDVKRSGGKSFNMALEENEKSVNTDQKEHNTETTRKPIARTTLDLRESLIEYIEQIFQEIKGKLSPINNIKEILSSDKMYKIGYIVATLDSVNLTINKLNKKLDINRDVWEVKKLQQVLRKLDLSNDLLDDVLNNLRNYVGY